jgi:tetratricopeptide (TPR) repeat protein
MSIVGPHEMPGLPTQAALTDFNVLANDLFNQGKYAEAILEYNRALGIHHKNSLSNVEFGPTDPLLLWNRSAAYVMVGKYRTPPVDDWINDRCCLERYNFGVKTSSSLPDNPVPPSRDPNTGP